MIGELLTSLRLERRTREDLEYRIDILLNRLYGKRSEKIDPNQLLLFYGCYLGTSLLACIALGRHEHFRMSWTENCDGAGEPRSVASLAVTGRAR